MVLMTILFLVLLACILTHSQLSLSYAGMGLELWFRNMIPSLMPFMILSGIMIRMGLTDKAAMIAYPVVRPVYKVRKNVCYAMLMGFLCGFPMGARVVDDLYRRRMITGREAEYLLAFCNNIGPVYFCSFVLPLLGRKLVFPYLFGMYGLPLLYGLLLRYTAYRDIPRPDTAFTGKLPFLKKGLSIEKKLSWKKGASTGDRPEGPLISCEKKTSKGLSGAGSLGERFLAEADDSVQAAVQAMLALGGYMVLYNILNLIPHIILGHPLKWISPLLEITGGLKLLGGGAPLYSLLALSFGGLCCIAQTYNCIGDSDLSMGKYLWHKIILTLLNGLFYFCWFQSSPSSFLR